MNIRGFVTRHDNLTKFTAWSCVVVALAITLNGLGWPKPALVALAFASALMATIWTVALWLLAPWEDSQMGRALMAMSASLAGALDFSLVNALVHHHYPGEYVIALVLYAAITAATGNLFRLLLNHQSGTPTLLQMEGSGHEPDRSQDPR